VSFDLTKQAAYSDKAPCRRAKRKESNWAKTNGISAPYTFQIFRLSQFADESFIDELEKEGFYKRSLAPARTGELQ
jgi:hypothetical protein